MSFIFAAAASRLHADLIVVRLKQAGLPMDSISILHPHDSCPNSAQCWLSGSDEVNLSSGPLVTIAGRLGETLAHPGTDEASQDLATRLRALGMSIEESKLAEDTLLEGRILVALDSEEQDHVDTAMAVLRKVTAEKIIRVPHTAESLEPVSVESESEFATMLSSACAELQKLGSCAHTLSEKAAQGRATTMRADEIATLEAMADEGYATLFSRLSVLGIPVPSPSRAPFSANAKRPSRRLRSLVSVYRRTSRRLCEALQSAKATSDSVSAGMLRNLIVRLEKQLWLLDGPAPKAGHDRRTVIGLFATS